MKKQKNNKGFSLVELIVVIAIMAILAVTLAPRLSAYVEKARLASDKEAVNAIYTAVKLAVLDDATMEDALNDTSPSVALNIASLPLGDSIDATDDTMYEVSAGGDFTLCAGYADNSRLLIQEISNVVGDFQLKSSAANEDTTITLKITSTGSNYDVEVVLDYDGTSTDSGNEYTASDASVR